MPVESVASQLPSGAGRFMDVIWPDTTQYGNFNPGGNLRGRIGFGTASQAQASARTTAIAGGTTAVFAAINGVACAQLPCSAGAPGPGQQIALNGMGSIQPRTSRSNLGPWADDQSAYRIVCNMWGGGQTMSGDFGMQIVQVVGITGGILGDTNFGIGLQIPNANVVQLLVRGAGGLVTTPLTAAPFDTTVPHNYELQIVSATPTAEASLSLFIDRAPIALPSNLTFWGAGTSLPTTGSVGGRIGFMPSVISAGNGNSSLFVQTLHVMSAPSILMTF